MKKQHTTSMVNFLLTFFHSTLGQNYIKIYNYVTEGYKRPICTGQDNDGMAGYGFSPWTSNKIQEIYTFAKYCVWKQVDIIKQILKIV